MLTTFMAHVAERQETVVECFGAFRVKEVHSAEGVPATQRKAKRLGTKRCQSRLRNIELKSGNGRRGETSGAKRSPKKR